MTADSYISCEDLNELMQDPAHRSQLVLLDIREEWEFKLAHLEGSLLLSHLSEQVDLSDFIVAVNKLQKEVVTICHHGARSHTAANFLRDQGLSQVRSLAGGINGWAIAMDPAMARY